MAGFGRDFGQKVDLVARIRQALQDYPPGVSMFKEFIQNADDAGARCMQICFDMRSHAASSTAWRQNAEDLQGPALLVYNDATFSDGDFANITQLGNSDKVSKVNKIGRFGVGVNVMYHLSDVPSFVSRDRYVFFDPHATFLPGVNPAMPGKSIFFLGEDKDVVSEYSSMFDPFRAFGFSPDAQFDGTLFRLPLRSQALAESSRLSNQVYSHDEMHQLLQSFAREMSSCLIFLKSVESISISTWQPDAPAPSPLYSSSLTSVPRQSFTRARLDEAASGKCDLSSPSTHTDTLHVTTQCAVTLSRIDETFVVSSQVGSDAQPRPLHPSVAQAAGSVGKGSINTALLSKQHPKLRLVPLAAVAVRTAVAVAPPSHNTDAASSPHVKTQSLFESIVEYGKTGRLFCFLPLPITSGLPVHVNSTFEVSSSRRDIWKLDEGSAGDGAARGLWNILVVQEVAIACYTALLTHIVSTGSLDPNLAPAREFAATFYALLPPASNVVVPFWREDLVCALYAAAGANKILRDSGSGSWTKPSDVTSLLSLPAASSSLKQALVDILTKHSVPFITDGDGIDHEQLQLLHEHAGLHLMSPSHLIHILTTLQSSSAPVITHAQAVLLLPYILSASATSPQAQTFLISLFHLAIIPTISGQVLPIPQSSGSSARPVPLRFLTAAEQGAVQFFAKITTVKFIEPAAATPDVVRFFSHDGVKRNCDIGYLAPSDVPAVLNALCDVNNKLNADYTESAWANLLMRSDEWYAAAAEFAVVPAFGSFLRPDSASRCCFLVDDETHMPAGVVDALHANGIASLPFASLAPSPSAVLPRWLRKAFVGHSGSQLVVALRDAMQPGRFQNSDQCDTLRRFFFSELKQYAEEWDEAARLALKQLPIHKVGALRASKSLTACAAIDDDGVVVGPTGGSVPIDSSWLANTLIVTSGSDEDTGYDNLRVPKISAAQWYREHFFPSIDDFDTAVCVAALQKLLDNLPVLGGCDHSFVEFLKENGRFMTASGTLVHVTALTVPANASSALIMGTSNAPAPDLTGEFRTQELVNLGARSRPNNDDIKRSSSVISAAIKSGWSEDATSQSLKHLASAAAAVQCLNVLVAGSEFVPDATFLDTAARVLSTSTQLISCASLDISVATLPSILRLLVLLRRFVASHEDFEENVAYHGRKMQDIIASATSDLVAKVGFFDRCCRDALNPYLDTPLSSDAPPRQSYLAAAPGPNTRLEDTKTQLFRVFESVMLPAIYFLPADDPILAELLDIGLRHIDNMVVKHGLSTVLSVRRKLPQLVVKKSFWSCLCGVAQPAHLVDPWGSPEVVKEIQSVSDEQWLPVLSSLQFMADALIEIAETFSIAGSVDDEQSTFPSVKLSHKLRKSQVHTSRYSSHTTSVYDGIHSYDLSTLLTVKERPALSAGEKKLLDSAHLALQNLHALARVLVSKTLVYDLNSVLYGRLFVDDINLLDQIKSCVLVCLADIKKKLKGDSGSNANLIVLLSSIAHIVTLSLVDDAILNGGPSRKFSKSLAVKLEAQLQGAQHAFGQWLLDNVTDFVPVMFPQLFKSKHLEFLITEIVPMMQRDSAELVNLFHASYAKAQNHVPTSSPYFLSRAVLARDDGDAAAAAFRRELEANDLQRDYLNNMNRPPSTVFHVVMVDVHDV